MADDPRRLLEGLADLTGALAEPTDDEIDAQLRAEGIDPDRVASRILGRVRRSTWLGASQLQRRSQRDSSTAARAQARRLDRAQLLALIEQHRGAVSAQFRNADQLPDDDLRQIVVDLGLLDGG